MRRKLLFVVLVLGLTGTPLWLLYPVEARPLLFPNGKRFAFTIVDDTDMATLERIRPLYAVLEKYGLRTTKTVWMQPSRELSHDANRGESLQDPAYRQFILELHRKGFEIALHGVRGGSSRRQETIDGIEEFKRLFGGYPRMFVNHSLNKDNIYWGKHLFDVAPFRWAGALAIRHEFAGHDPQSEYFWGDVAQQHVQFVRRFTFSDINLLNVNPSFPYRLPSKPYVNYWFPTANGNRILEFDELLKPENLERLDSQGGVCLVYAHLGAGSFNKNGGADPRFEARIKELTSRNGWFVTASEILDHLMKQPAWTGQLSFTERARLEARFITGRLLLGLD